MPSNDVLAPSRVQKTPGVCGGDACICHTRHTVAGLVRWRQLGLSDVQILERHPNLSQADLDAAWSYYDGNREEVDQALRSDGDA